MVGLSSAEVEERKRQGQVNVSESVTGRTYTDILVKNVFTPFNVILFILGALLLILGNAISAISATGIIICNILISTVQEMRAKRRLDKIAVLTRPRVTVIRDGTEQEIDQDEIVKDDLVVLRAGDQALVDGVLEECNALEMDESVLTGESSTIRKKAGEQIYSGSICVVGEARYTVTAFGDESFANRMLSDAKKYVPKSTPLQLETSTITQILMGIAFVLMGISVIFSLFRGHGLVENLEVFVICLDIVPMALFLLITITYMLAALRMADTGVLLQNSNSVESLSHVDTVCMDKTGTITTNNLIFESSFPLVPDVEAERICSVFATCTSSKNRTIMAMQSHFGTTDAAMTEEVQFSSSRKFSAVRADGMRIYAGAWNILREHCSRKDEVESLIIQESSKGLRTIVVCRSPDGPLFDGDEPVIADMEPVCVVSIRDEVRSDCKETIGIFLQYGMDIKVISGDDPKTVDALFSLAGIPGERKMVTGQEIDSMSPEELDRAAMECNVFGRMKPENKEAVIESLRRNGRYVAMIGDGVNDVRSLKKANVGVALESGSAAARGVSDMVLLNDNFAALPKALIEGRRTVSGMRDILKLYLSRNFVLALLFIVIYGFVGSVPMTPIQNTFYAFVSVTIIAFFMTVFAKPDQNKGMILPKVLRFCIPSAITIAAFGIMIYAVTWYAVDTGSLVVDFDYMVQFVPDSIATDAEELIDWLAWGDSGVNEICARSAMVTFVSFAGILQLLLICPPFRFLSPDGTVNRNLLAMGLIVLLLAIVIAMFMFVKPIAIGLVGLVIFPDWYFGVIAAALAVWIVVDLALLRLDVFAPLGDRFERFFLKKLDKAREKESVS